MVVSVGRPDSSTRKFIIEVLTTWDLKNAEVEGIIDKNFDFMEQKQNISVKLNSQLLVEGVDYEVIYFDNVEPGVAHMTITGIGKCYGIKEAKFNIMPQKFDISESNPYFD